MKISPFKIEEWMNMYEKGALYDLTTTCIKPLSIYELLELSGMQSIPIFEFTRFERIFR